jgi:hypothetical protein
MHGQTARDNFMAQVNLAVVIGQSLEKLGMARANLLSSDRILYFTGQLEQANEIGDGRARQAEPRCQLFVGQSEAIQVFLETLCFLNGIEVGALDVFDKGRLQHLLIIEVDHADRHRIQAGRPRRSQPPLARDQLKVSVYFPNN